MLIEAGATRRAVNFNSGGHMMVTKKVMTSGASVLAFSICLASPGAGHAQGTAPFTNNSAIPTTGEDHPNALSEVVVTARKRAEKLLDVPVAITAFTAQGLESRAIYSISDLAQFTPGLSEDSTVGGSGRNDRSFPEYVIRGMTPSLTTNPTTTVFIDGAPIISGQVSSIDDLERVEVLKGPQSAYFGRETFAGAISLITKDPGNTPSATINALAASPGYYDERISVEGPIIPDKLMVRGTYRYYSREGSYDNNAVADKASGHLGDQSTQSGSLEIVAKPIDNLKIKGLAMYWRDDDGPSAQALIVPSQSNCLGFWFCGTVPDRLSNQPAANTLVTPQSKALINYLGTPGVSIFKPLSDKYGLVRNAYHGSIGIDYDLPQYGMTFSSLTAEDNQRYSELQDLANDDGSTYPNFAYTLGLPYADPYGDFPFFVESAYRGLSQEFRLTSDQHQRFRWLIGVNYAWSRVDQSLGGGNGFDFFVGDSPDTSKTTGGFFGLNYDLLKRLTLTFEGRYQSDEESAYSTPTAQEFKHTFNNFLPRVSAQYHFTPDVMAYATYSEGVNPGTFNAFIPGLPAAEQQYLAQNFGAQVEVKPENLINYETGIKGRFLDGTATIAADIYYDVWSQQINTSSVQYFVGPTLETTTAQVNNGRTDLKGLEVDSTYTPLPRLNFNVSAAINDTKIVSGGCFTCLERIGTQDVDGNQLPNVSKYQVALGAEYGGSLSSVMSSFPQLKAWDWFARLDYTFKSGQYEDKDNLVKTPSENLVNLRAGLTSGNVRLEAFVDNLTNFDGATNLAAIVDLGNPAETYAHTNDALVAGLPQLRTFGVRLRYKFGL